MCDWSKWQWMCEGHYEIALTILLVIAILVALTMATMIAFGKKRNMNAKDKAIDQLREAFALGEITSDEFLEKCDDKNSSAILSGKPVVRPH